MSGILLVAIEFPSWTHEMVMYMETYRSNVAVGAGFEQGAHTCTYGKQVCPFIVYTMRTAGQLAWLNLQCERQYLDLLSVGESLDTV